MIVSLLLCCNLLGLTNFSRNNSGNLELINVQAVIENALYQDIVSVAQDPCNEAVQVYGCPMKIPTNMLLVSHSNATSLKISERTMWPFNNFASVMTSATFHLVIWGEILKSLATFSNGTSRKGGTRRKNHLWIACNLAVWVKS